MQKFGVDVSHWQGNFDFARAKKEGAEFAVIKCGGADGGAGSGLYKDSKFDANYKAAKAAGLPVGSYYFMYARTVDEAIAQAKHCESILPGQYEYPIMADVEGMMADLPAATLEPIIRAFCDHLEKAGYWVGMYFGLAVYYWHLQNAKALTEKYSWWLPYWGASKPNFDTVQMWQFGGETNLIRSNKVAGVVCDQNYCYIDYPAKIKAKGLNGFKAATATPANSSPAASTPAASKPAQSKPASTSSASAQKGSVKKTVDQLAEEVWAGKWGNNPERANKLKAAGYDPAAVQTRIEEKYYGKKTTQTTQTTAASSSIEVGDKVRMKKGAPVFGTTQKFFDFVYDSVLYVRGKSGNKITISTLKTGDITGFVDIKYLTKI